jgi:hypothetical protein
LIDLDILPFWFNEQNVGMKTMVNLSTGDAMIASISPVSLSSEAVERLCKLESHILLSDPFVSQKEVAVNDLLILDRPL